MTARKGNDGMPGLVGSYALTAMIYNTLRFDLLQGNEGLKHR